MQSGEFDAFSFMKKFRGVAGICF